LESAGELAANDVLQSSFQIFRGLLRRVHGARAQKKLAGGGRDKTMSKKANIMNL
jgi:hypothetical protein